MTGGRLRRLAGGVGRAAGRARWLGGALVGSALGGFGLALGVVVLVLAVTAPVTGCLAGGCPTDGLTVLDGVARWVGALVLLYAGGATFMRAWR